MILERSYLIVHRIGYFTHDRGSSDLVIRRSLFRRFLCHHTTSLVLSKTETFFRVNNSRERVRMSGTLRSVIQSRGSGTKYGTAPPIYFDTIRNSHPAPECVQDKSNSNLHVNWNCCLH